MKALSYSVLVFLVAIAASPASSFEKDAIPTQNGELEITFIGHGTLMFRFGEKVLHVDPVGRYADYSCVPKADVVLVTHHHGDHLDPAAIKTIAGPDTVVVVSAACLPKVPEGIVMANGESRTVRGVKVQAVPAYNLLHKRDDGRPFHPKGEGNGYVLAFADKRVYVAGDTEDIPEMASLSGIDVAFLPMNLPYTMTPEMVASAASMLYPGLLYPYHYGDTDVSVLKGLLAGRKGLEVRIRNLK